MKKSRSELGNIAVTFLLFVLSLIIAGCSATVSTSEAGAETLHTQKLVHYSGQPISITELPENTQKIPADELIYLQITNIEDIMAANSYATPEIQVIADSAVSLIGKVPYFWGGKSYTNGFDPAWGEMRKVTSIGHETTGTTAPYGLDCSGYVLWCFIQAYGRSAALDKIGEGTWFQWTNSEDVGEGEVMVGDFAFVNSYPGKGGNHIGIVIGFLQDGSPVVAHCSDTQDKVVASTCGTEFKFFRRPKIYNGN